MAKEIICAGFGGQGVLTAGMLLINMRKCQWISVQQKVISVQQKVIKKVV